MNSSGADLAREPHLVGDDHHRHAVACEPDHDLRTSPTSSGIERRGHLVEEHHLRVHRESPGDRDPLLLAAGEWPGNARALSAIPTRSNCSIARAFA